MAGIGLNAARPDAVAAARAEDALGCGLAIGEALASRLKRLDGGGRPLPSRLARGLGRELDADLGPVRVHAGREAAAWAAGCGAAGFCLDRHVFLGRAARSSRAACLDVLRHELAHVALRPEPRRLRFWFRYQGREIHGELTRLVCREFAAELDRLCAIENLSLRRDDLIRGLEIASSNMDIRNRILPPWILMTVIYGISLLLSKIGVPGLKGEGPNHGEGYIYTVRSWPANVALNEAAQRGWIALAVREFQVDRALKIDDALGTYRAPKSAIAINEKEWVKSLANALHVAQDRGSHREGVRGYGHSDPRCDRKPAWSPDEPYHEHSLGCSWERCSMAAYNKAINNSFEVMRAFLSAVGIEPHDPPPRPTTCSTSDRPWPQAFRPEECEAYLNLYPNPYNRSVPGEAVYPGGHPAVAAPLAPLFAAHLDKARPPVGRGS